jgi:hypothetical protein
VCEHAKKTDKAFDGAGAATAIVVVEEGSLSRPLISCKWRFSSVEVFLFFLWLLCLIMLFF